MRNIGIRVLRCPSFITLSVSSGTAIVRVDQEHAAAASESTRLLPAAPPGPLRGLHVVTATAQTQTEHNEECGCKAITTAVGRSNGSVANNSAGSSGTASSTSTAASTQTVNREAYFYNPLTFLRKRH